MIPKAPKEYTQISKENKHQVHLLSAGGAQAHREGHHALGLPDRGHNLLKKGQGSRTAGTPKSSTVWDDKAALALH